MRADRLSSQLRFIVEVDELKHVLRQTLLPRDQRRENDAEHSWHLALMAVVLAEHAEGGVDPLRVVKMALIHDLVEIDAGDTFAYDADGHRDKVLREERAAERLFNLLPADQAGEVRQLWDEFEAQETPAARYAGALDRLQPVLLNPFSGGGGWRRHGITKQQVIDYNQHIAEGAPDLWDWVQEKIEEAVADGVLPE